MNKRSVRNSDWLSSSLGHTGGAVGLLSPNGSCWICESPLVHYPSAVLVAQPSGDIFCLVCSEACGAIAAGELAGINCAPAQLLDGVTAFAHFCEAPKRTLFAISNKAYRALRQGRKLRLSIFGPKAGGYDCE